MNGKKILKQQGNLFSKEKEKHRTNASLNIFCTFFTYLTYLFILTFVCFLNNDKIPWHSGAFKEAERRFEAMPEQEKENIFNDAFYPGLIFLFAEEVSLPLRNFLPIHKNSAYIRRANHH
jgi:hypothetical protein